MSAPAAAPTTEELEASLDLWRDRRIRADYTESFVKMRAEKAECDRRIAEIKARIARAGESL